MPVAWLSVDPRYQRTLDSRQSQLLIARIAANFRWAMFQAILVTPKPGGKPRGEFLIIDGQHRAEGAKLAGIDEVPAVIVEAASVADQAAAFVGANQSRVAVNPYALYHARLTAGEPEAQRVALLCRTAGVSIPRSPSPADRLKPGQTIALGAITMLPIKFGDVVAQLALSAVADAYRDNPGGLRAAFFVAAARIIAQQPSDLAKPTAGRVTVSLRRIGWEQADQLIRSRRARYGGSIYDSAVAVIRQKMPTGAASAGPGLERLMAGR